MSESLHPDDVQRPDPRPPNAIGHAPGRRALRWALAASAGSPEPATRLHPGLAVLAAGRDCQPPCQPGGKVGVQKPPLAASGEPLSQHHSSNGRSRDREGDRQEGHPDPPVRERDRKVDCLPLAHRQGQAAQAAAEKWPRQAETRRTAAPSLTLRMSAIVQSGSGWAPPRGPVSWVRHSVWDAHTLENPWRNAVG
jgi:hypothetical protein